jgi:hypothetical protein
MVRAVLTGALLLALACGGSNKPPPGDPGRAADAGAEPAAADATAAEQAGSNQPLTQAECDRFVDHVVELAAEMLAARAENPDHANTPEEIATIQDKLRAEMRADCLRVDRATFDCAMNATSATALAGCQTSGGEASAPR